MTRELLDRLLAAAERYAAIGWYVVACHGIKNGACTCGRSDCKPGKHPHTPHGVNDATKDIAVIRQCFQRWPDSNIGIACKKSGFVALDVDPRNGGDDSLAELVAKHGALPDTRQQTTGGGGQHILFRHPGAPVKDIELAAGIDVKSKGLIIVPPSLHASGNRYIWDGLEDTGIAEPPEWLKKKLVSGSPNGKASVPAVAQKIAKGQRHTALLSYAGRLRRSGCGYEELLSSLLDFNQRWCVPPKAESEVRKLAEDVAQRYEPTLLDDESPEATELARLAGLDPIDYDRQRQAAAKRLGVRVPTLDAEVRRLKGESAEDAQSGVAFDLTDPEPWPTPVDGTTLLDELVQTVSRYVVLPKFAAEAVALWTLHAHAHDTAFISPILAITSPVLGCGKTTLHTLLSALTPRSLTASNLTAASLFRAVEKWRPTLLIDEADTYLRESDDLRGLLNSGHNKGAAYCLRCVGEDHEPRVFSTWCGKAIALIGKLHPTLASRSIHIEMRRLGPGEQVAMLRADRLGHMEPMRRMAWRWSCDNDEALRNADPEVPASLQGRAADNWRPLLAIADLAGSEWSAKARQATEALEVGDDAEGLPILLLRDLRDLFEERDTDRLASENIVNILAQKEDRPWPEYKRDKPITPRQLATLLKGFGIEPRTIRLDSSETARGYLLDNCREAFTRYTPNRSDTATQSRSNAAFSESRSNTNQADLVDEKATERNNNGSCVGVSDRAAPIPGRKEVLDL